MYFLSGLRKKSRNKADRRVTLQELVCLSYPLSGVASWFRCTRQNSLFRALAWPIIYCMASFTAGAQGAEESAGPIEEVVVTGSYIKRSAADSASPLSVMSSADIERMQVSDVQELLLRLPYESGGWIRASTFDGGGGQGRVPINLRNLGDCSTLPLVNGRRHVTGWLNPSGCAAVDTNSMIPTLMVDRVEILKDGSSALYGSDAIAGVVNFLTKDDFEGFEFDTRYVVDEPTGRGEEKSMSMLFGIQGDRGGVVIGMDYLSRDEIPTIEPEVFKIQGGAGYSDTGQPGWYHSPSNKSQLRFKDGSLIPNLSKNKETGKWYVQTKVDPDNPSYNYLPRKANPRLPGTKGWEDDWGNADLNCEDAAEWDGPGGTLGLFDAGGFRNMRCSYDYGPFFSIQEQEVMQKFYASGHFALTENIELFFEGGYAEQEFFRLNSLAPQTRAPTIPVHNLGLIEDANRRGIQPTPLVNRSRLVGGTPRTPSHIRPLDTQQDGDRDTIRLVVGFDWDMQFGERDWTLHGSFTSSENSSYQYNVEDSRANELVLALNGLGGPNCNSAGKDQEWIDKNRGSGNKTYKGDNFEDGNCYYLNPFGSSLFDADGKFRDPKSANANHLSNPPELLNWLDGTWTQNDEYEQNIIDVVFAGDLFEMPAGTVGLAVGYQQRKDNMNRHYDINFRQFNAAFRFGGSNVRGKLTTNAYFTELSLPLMDSLDAQLAVRHESFDEIGQSTTDPKISFLFRPNDAWSGRFSWGQSFRVGSILQLVGPQTIVSNTDDPYQDTSFFVPWISAGQPNLKPEKSKAMNIGVSWSPQSGMLEGLSVNLDHWRYTYENLITKESAPGLLFEDGCARARERAAKGGDAVPARCTEKRNNAQDQIQAQVIRNANGSPVRILPNFINANEAKATGVDLEVTYDIDLDNLGLLDVGVIAAWFQKYEVKTATATYDGVGSMNRLTPVARPLPEWKINFNVGWTRGSHSVFWQTRFVDEVVWDGGWSAARRLRVLRATGRDIGTYASNSHRLKATWWSDLYYTYQLPSFFEAIESASITVGVRNLFAEEPPPANNANGYSAILHDARGRMWMVRYRMSL